MTLPHPHKSPHPPVLLPGGAQLGVLAGGGFDLVKPQHQQAGDQAGRAHALALAHEVRHQL